MFTEVGPTVARERGRREVGADGRTRDLVAVIGTETGIGRETGTGRGIVTEKEVQSRIGSGTVISTPTGIEVELGTRTGRETQMVQGAAGNEIVRDIESAGPEVKT